LVLGHARRGCWGGGGGRRVLTRRRLVFLSSLETPDAFRHRVSLEMPALGLKRRHRYFSSDRGGRRSAATRIGARSL
jgi:hypothetical protein